MLEVANTLDRRMHMMARGGGSNACDASLMPASFTCFGRWREACTMK